MSRFKNTQKQYPPHTMTYPCTHPHTTIAPRFGNPRIIAQMPKISIVGNGF